MVHKTNAPYIKGAYGALSVKDKTLTTGIIQQIELHHLFLL